MFEPENDLERSLVSAADDPAHRPNFLLRMLNAQVVVVLQPDGPQASGSPDGRATTSPQGKMKLPMMRDGHQEYLPVFTALSRAKASSNGQPVFASVPARNLFERHPGKHFMLNPGHEHAQKFLSDDVNRMLAGQFGGPVVIASTPSEQVAKPASANAVVTEPPAAMKPEAANTRLTTEPAAPAPIMPQASTELPATDFVPKPKAPVPTPPAATHQQSVSPPVRRPTAPPVPPVNQVFAAEDAFLFDPEIVQTPAPTKPVSPDKPTVPPPASTDDKAPGQPASSAKSVAPKSDVTPEPEVTAAAASKPTASEPAAVKPSVPERTGSLKTAAVGAFAAVKRLAAKTQPSNKPEQSFATPAMPTVSAEIPPVAKPSLSAPPAEVVQPFAPKATTAAEPVVPKPPAVTRPTELKPSPSVIAPAPPVPEKPVEASDPPAPTKSIESSSAKAAAHHVEAGSPPAPPKPVAPPQPPPAPNRPRVAPPPPGSQIGAADPYPVDVLFALTMAVQGMPAIDAAHLAQVQFPGRQPHLLVALDTPENWEPLAQRLRTLLPASRTVEFTPLTGGMFEDYFRNETQPFFKRR